MNMLFLVLLIAVASAQYDNDYQHDHYGYDSHDEDYGHDDYGHYDYDEHGHDDYDYEKYDDYGHDDYDQYDDYGHDDYDQYDDYGHDNSDNLVKKYDYHNYKKYGDDSNRYDGDDFAHGEYKAHLYPRFDLLKDLQVSGAVSDGTQFSGTLTITGIKYEANVLYVKGFLKETGGDIPAEFEWTNASIVAQNDKKRQTAVCPVLTLVLGPLNLNLLGLVVTLNQIILNIIAVAGPNNLLGNLLCAVANLLAGNLTAQLQALLGNLVAILNGLLALA